MEGVANASALLARQTFDPNFNYEFLIFLIICGVLAVFFLLYFNRLFASVVSYAIRTYTWHRYRVYIDIQALQISLLGGRVFFTGLRYHGSNQSFLIQHGEITWRYWLRRVREVDIQASRIASHSNTLEHQTRNESLPSRINVKLVGLEWFVYNRSPAYDTIISGLAQSRTSESYSNDIFKEEDTSGLRQRASKEEEAGREPQLDKTDNGLASGHEKETARSRMTTDISRAHRRPASPFATSETDLSEDDSTPELPFLLQLFPIHIDCLKPAVVMGNDNTKSILIVKANSLSADVDASEAKTPDQYKQEFKVHFKHPVVEMKNNDEFKEDQVSRAAKAREHTHVLNPVSRMTFIRQQRRKVLGSLRNMIPYWRKSVESFSANSRPGMSVSPSQLPGANHWQGLTRYLDDRDLEDKSRWASIEYGAESSILDSPEATLCVYWDAVGKVSQEAHQQATQSTDPYIRINGGAAPAWGMRFSVKGGTMNYGPWADRQRADLQRVFFPALSKDAVLAESLPVGAWRVATQFNLFVELEDAVTLRIPVREQSKNWRWRGKEPPMKQQQSMDKRKQRNKARKGTKGEAAPQRPSGWLEMKIPLNSSVSYSMDMLAGPDGYSNTLEIDIPHSELWSSVNHDLLWRSGPQRISCDLSNSLCWNTLRNWRFKISSEDLDLYILRDHIFLLIDLIDDWTSGSPSEYLVFTPFKYHLDLQLRNLKLYLNVNDENIIDKATSLDDNSYLLLSTPLLKAESCIPIDKYMPKSNAIPFNVRANSVALSLQAPQWNTLASFLTSRELALIDALHLTGSYNYNATTSPANTDTLVLKVLGQSPNLYLYGYIVRYLILLKDNYFGDHIHFRTLDEYQEQLALKNKNPGVDSLVQAPYKKSNDLDVVLSVKVDDPCLMIPTNLYSAEDFIQGEVASFSVDLRFTNYYMDMELDLSPLSLSLGSSRTGMDSPAATSSSTQLFIDGLRVFGHRTFGLPPTEPTYLCNWDVNVGAVSGECTTDFISALAKGGAAFGFTFDDVENALVPYSSIIFHDITFARVTVESVHLWFRKDDFASLLSTDIITVNSNDWAGSHYSKRADIDIPNIQLSCINAESAMWDKVRHHNLQRPVDTEAFVQLDMRLASVGRKHHFVEERKIQQELVRREDQRTDRTPFFLFPDYAGTFTPEPVDPPAQCAPPPPPPVVEISSDGDTLRTSNRSQRSRALSRQHSFLSLSDSKRSSVRRSRYVGTRFTGSTKNKSIERQSGLRRDTPEAVSSDNHSRHTVVDFSSLYTTPHFPLDGIQPDKSDVPASSGMGSQQYDQLQTMGAKLNEVDTDKFNEGHVYSSALVEFPNGINAFVKPQAVKHLTSLLTALQPNTPDDMLDSLQIDTMTDIFREQKKEHIGGETQDFFILLPSASLRLLNASNINPHDSSVGEQDQYDMSISDLSLVLRSAKDRNSGYQNDGQSRIALLLRLESVELSASERLQSMEKIQAAVMARIDKVMVSLGTKDVMYLDAEVGSVTGNTASGKIEYLASLIHRTGNVVLELEHVLAESSERHNIRRKYFTHRLLKDGESTNDPSFLIRPSAVLRSAHQHLRTFDSWKLMMRLRQIWTMMRNKASSKLTRDCWDNAPILPGNVHDMVITAFQEWRSWDLDNIQQAALLKSVFGTISDTNELPHTNLPVLAALRLGEISFVLDPGPKQNRIGFHDVSARVDKRTTTENPGEPEAQTSQNFLTTVSVSCTEAAVNLTWEICELTEDTLQLYNRNKTTEDLTRRSTKNHNKQENPKQKPHQSTIHVVLDVSRVSAELETINIRAESLGDGLKASMINTEGAGDTSFTSFVMSCNAVTSRLHSHARILGLFQLRVPSVLLSHELQVIDKAHVHAIKSTASSQGLTLAVEQDVMSLMEITDLVLRDEIDRVYRLVSRFSTPTKSPSPTKITDRLSSLKVNAVLFLDEYNVSIPLVQSLTYRISGVVARVACAANYGKEVIFDFDIKENSHEIQINVNNQPRSISLLEIPPTNGRITSQMTDAQHAITVVSSVELIHLDASSIYSLLAALNRPQVSNAIQEIRQEATIIQGHVSEIFGSEGRPTPNESTKSNQKLRYNVYSSLAGLQVLAKTSLKSKKDPTAQVLFYLDKIHLQASNRHSPESPTTSYPDLHVDFRDIGLDIQRGHERNLRSCGSLGTSVTISAKSSGGNYGKEEWSFNFRSDDFDVKLSPETISTVIDVLGYMREKIKYLDTSRELDYLRKLRQTKPRISINDDEAISEDTDILDSVLASLVYHFELRNIRLCWIVAEESKTQATDEEDLVLSIALISFGTKSKKSATLAIENFQLQTVPPGQDKAVRSLHSALLPEVIFNIAYVSTANARRMAFQAVGESLDLRLTSAFIVPAANLIRSISLSMANVRQASAQWNTDLASAVKKPTATPNLERERSILGNKRLESLLIDADFAGAVVYISGKRSNDDATKIGKYDRPTLAGKYGQFNADDSGSGAVLRSPGLAWKAEYRDNQEDVPTLHGEIKVDASSNILYPSVVPLVLDIISTVKEVVSDEPDDGSANESAKPPDEIPATLEKGGDNDKILTTDPAAVLGRIKLNLGLRICKQEFSLSCQPIARVAATTSFENFYFTINTVTSQERGNFFAISGALSKPHASVQHVYSRESTGSVEVDYVTLSFMNSKHVSGTSGVSAILKVSPMKVAVNAKQVQDFLLFREIWYPKEIRNSTSVPVTKPATETSQGHLVQRYQQVAATAAFPWTATISIASLDVSVDLGQLIGKSVFEISNFWVSSKKTSDWEQNLCLGFDKIGIDCTGRLSGFVALQRFRLRTSIQWPRREQALNETPLVQASLGFNALRVKAAFDYQAFLVADVTSLEFLMYNVRESQEGRGDRLVAIFDGDAVQVFGTTSSAAQVVSVYQAIQKLIQERRENFESSLQEIEKFMKRKSAMQRNTIQTSPVVPKLPEDDTLSKSPISLDTDVVVTLRALNLGVFPSTFSDHQVFKMEALNAYARFAASVEQRRIHSVLRMTLGQLRIGLAGVRHIEAPKPLSEMSVDDVVRRSTGSRGGTILKVPKVEALMETWQAPNSNHIEYIFKSAFEGKVEVGWNYSRISYIRGMWANHSKSLERTWGRQLPMTAVKITGVPEAEGEQGEGEQQKITAEVNVPQSKYEYQALEPAIIETPQLRDMGEATPPLEWIGLHRDRLPNLTHQIVIVSLLELAGEVEDAYSRILGSS